MVKKIILHFALSGQMEFVREPNELLYNALEVRVGIRLIQAFSHGDSLMKIETF
mgnify:CR=1 FL=1